MGAAARAECGREESHELSDVVLLDHRDLWVPEPTPATGQLSHLIDEERAVVTMLRELGNVRLEQERLTWPMCVERLRSAATRRAEGPSFVRVTPQ